MQTKNLDISMLGNTLLLFRKEVYKSASGETFNVDSDDIARQESYLARMEADLAYAVSQPKLDLPKWHPVVIDMPEMPTDYNLDSPTVVYILRLMDAGYHELLNSQSSDKSNGLEDADHARYQRLIDRLKNWVANVKATQEIDAPEMANIGGQ